MTDHAFNGGRHLLASGARFSRAPGLIARLLAPGFARIVDRRDAGLEQGTLTLHLPGGVTRQLGGRAPGFSADLTIHDWRALLRLATRGSIGAHHAWGAGKWASPHLTPLFCIFCGTAVTLGTLGSATGLFPSAARIAARPNTHQH